MASTGFRLYGGPSAHSSGSSVAAAGDINGDGLDDLVIGAPRADPNMLSNAGSSYVLFGRSTGFDSTINLSTLAGSIGFRLDGGPSADSSGWSHSSGWSVAAAGDINGDGLDDLIVGAPYANSNGANSGSSYVLFGRDTTLSKSGFFPQCDKPFYSKWLTARRGGTE